MAWFAAIALASALAPVLAWAQSSLSELPHGARLRVQSPSFGTERLLGRFVGIRGDTLMLEQAASVFVVRSIPVVLDHRSRVEISLRHGSHAVQGAAMGAALGLVFGLIVEEFRSGLESFPSGDRRRSAGPVLAGLAIGGFAGLAVGSAVPKDEWRPVTIEPSSFRIIQPATQVRLALKTCF